jgi:hypothetical protein
MRPLLHPIILISLLSSGAAASSPRSAANDAVIGGPVLGYVYDGEARALRPILGIPGAALLGEAIDTGAAFTTAAIAPRQNYALATTEDGSANILIRLERGIATATPLSGAAPAADKIAISPSGNAAALYFAPAGSLTVFIGLPDSPTSLRTLDIRMVSGTLDALALSDDGEMILLRGTDLWLSSGGATPAPLQDLRGLAFAFRPASHDAVTVAADGQIWLLQEGLTAASAGIPLSEGATPVAAQFASAGLTVHVAASGGSIFSVDLETGTSTQIPCNCAPTGIQWLNSSGLFRLTEPSRKPVLLLDTSGGQQRIWFVPPTVPVERSGQ